MKKSKFKASSSRILLGTLLLICSLLFVTPVASAADKGLMADPMTIGIGARAIGMGRAYVGVAEDGDAVFSNPAGIARVGSPKLSSMYSSLLNEISYIVVGGAYPFGDYSALGGGVINSRTGNIVLRNASGEVTGTGDWGNTVLFLSYATYLNKLPMMSILSKDILVGTNLKYYSVGGSGSTTIQNAAASGFGLDLAMLYPATDYIMVGANYQNALRTDLSKSGDVADVIPATLKLGTKINLIGKRGKALTFHGKRKLYANVDLDINSNNRPNATHLGLEFWPNSNLAFRVGSDNNELTAGLGVRYAGIEFNYAYHPYSSIADNASHFFSLGYLGEVIQRELRVKIDNPSDKTVIHKDYVDISGRVEVIKGNQPDAEEPGLITVKVNGVNIAVNESDYSFKAQVPVKNIGKNTILVEAFDSAGDYISQDFRIVRLINFADVPDGYWAVKPIENTGTVGLIEGYPDGTFKPKRALTRAELATLLVRAKGLNLPKRQARNVFKDVKSDHWAAKYIEVAKTAGLIQGYPDKTFRPNNKISMAEGVTVMARFDNLKTASVTEKPFWDVSEKHWAAKHIAAAKNAGLLGFVEKNQLGIKGQLTRAQAVTMLSNTQLAGGKIKDLFSWEKGFKTLQNPGQPRTRRAI